MPKVTCTQDVWQRGERVFQAQCEYELDDAAADRFVRRGYGVIAPAEGQGASAPEASAPEASVREASVPEASVRGSRGRRS